MEEERWIRMLRGLNVLPLIVCFLLFILIIGVGKANDFKFIPIPLGGLLAYFFFYFIELHEQRSNRIAWLLALNLISTTFWLIVFFAFCVDMFTIIDIMPILFSVFIVGYPLCMLYYNFRLFMNEISK